MTDDTEPPLPTYVTFHSSLFFFFFFPFQLDLPGLWTPSMVLGLEHKLSVRSHSAPAHQTQIKPDSNQIKPVQELRKLFFAHRDAVHLCTTQGVFLRKSALEVTVFNSKINFCSVPSVRVPSYMSFLLTPRQLSRD